MSEDIKYKEKLLKRLCASKVLKKINNELRKEFGEKLFDTAHVMLKMESDNFKQENKKNILIGRMIAKQGGLSALSQFVANNESVLSDEVIRRFKERFKETYIGLFRALTELTENKAKESSDE